MDLNKMLIRGFIVLIITESLMFSHMKNCGKCYSSIHVVEELPTTIIYLILCDLAYFFVCL